MMQEAAEEVDMLAADIEGKLTAKDIVAWKEAVASYVHSSIFPRGSRIMRLSGGVGYKR